MKKLLIILMLLFLVGCTSQGEQILDTPEFDENVCGDDCVTELDTISEYFEEFDDILEEMRLAVTPDISVEPNLLNTNVLYDRTEINTIDPCSFNYDILVYYIPTEFASILNFSRNIVRFCEIGDICDNPMLYPEQEITDFDYGFNESGGFTNYTVGVNDNLLYKITVKFQFSEEDSWYEWMKINYDNNSFDYRTYRQGVYRQYQYFSDNEYHFLYFNNNTRDRVEYLIYEDTGEEQIQIYNPENQFYYYKSDSNIEVRKYDDLEFVASLGFRNPDYVYQFSFHYVEEWDRILFRDPDKEYKSKLYLDGEEVFSDYDIIAFNSALRYTSINANQTVAEEDLQGLEFPEEFTGDVTMSELLKELTDFMNNTSPLQTYGLTPQNILDKMKEIYESIEFVSNTTTPTN